MVCDNLEGWEAGGRFKREGMYVYLQLIHVIVWQKPTRHCKDIFLQLKNKKEALVGGHRFDIGDMGLGI